MSRLDKGEPDNPPRPVRSAGAGTQAGGNPAWRWLKSAVGVNAAIVLFNAILLGTLWNAVVGVLQVERENTIRAAIDRNDNLAIAFEQYTIRTFENADAVIQYLIRAYLRGGRTMDLEKFVADFNIDNNVIVGVVLADEHGDAKTTAYTGNSATSANLADREHFRVHIDHDTGRVFVGKPVIGRVAGRWIIPITRRINKPDGTFGGVAMALIEPRVITNFLLDAKLRPLDIVSLVGLDGVTRARLTGTTASWGQDISKSLLFVEQARRPDGNYSAKGQLDNVSRFFSYRTLPDYRLIATVGSAETNVMGEFDRRQMLYFRAAALASVLIAGFAALLILALARQRKAAANVLGIEEKFRATFEQAAVGIGHTSLDRRFLLVNQKLCDMLGYTRDELLAKRTDEIAHHDDQDYASMQRALAGGLDTYAGEMRYIRKDGSVLWVNRTISLVRDSAGKPLYFIRVVEDIAVRKQTQERITYLAQYDSLTGLPNRRLFRDRLALAIARAQRNNQRVALLYIDLDRFKDVNDALGHSAGDEVLQIAAGLLRVSLREVDTIARLGGDEFTVLLEDATQPDYVTTVVEKIKKAFAEPFAIHGRELTVTTSIGIAFYPQDAIDADALLNAADVAMYQVKKEGRNSYEFYSVDMNAQADDRLSMGNLLRHALERREFLLHYQPRVETSTGRVVGVEALVRWNSRELGLFSTESFIALIEETGLIVPIGEWALKTACAQSVAWQALGLPPLLMSVNVSPRQLRQKNLVGMVAAVLKESGLKPEHLEIEITEGVIMENIHQNIGVLNELQRLGVKFAIDGFGAGHSSLSYLTKLPVHALKIDRSFIVDMLKDADSMSLVSTILNMARSLRLKVIAEGVETDEQKKLLRLLQCDEMQGFFISRPLPATEMTAFLAQALQRDAGKHAGNGKVVDGEAVAL